MMRKIVILLLFLSSLSVNAQNDLSPKKVMVCTSRNDIIAQGLYDGSLLLISGKDGKQIMDKKWSDNSIVHVDINQEGDRFLITDCSLQAFIVKDSVQKLKNLPGNVSSAIFSPDEQEIICVGPDSPNELILYNPETVAQSYVWKLPKKFTNDSLFVGVLNVFRHGEDIALQMHYCIPGLQEWQYPFIEKYNPYEFKQTAWDSIVIFSYPDLRPINSFGLSIPGRKAKELKRIEKESGNLVFMRYEKGFEVISENTGETAFYNHEADLSAISPDGKKITYVEYKEFAVPEDSYFANCMVDYYIDNEMLISYNRLSSSPYGDSYYEEKISQMQKVDDNDKYIYLCYNQKNQLVYKKNRGKEIALTLEVVPPPHLIYYSQSSSNVPSKIIDTQFFPETNLLYILSYVNDFELDYTGYIISMLNIENGEYYAQVKIELNDTNNVIEFNPETSAPSEIRDKLTFELDKDYKQDSIELHSYFSEENDFLIREYVYDIKDSILVFSDASGLIKMNINTKEYFQFAYADIIIWINNIGSTHSLFNYKSVYITDNNKILTIQENNTILLWNVESVNNF